MVDLKTSSLVIFSTKGEEGPVNISTSQTGAEAALMDGSSTLVKLCTVHQFEGGGLKFVIEADIFQ